MRLPVAAYTVIMTPRNAVVNRQRLCSGLAGVVQRSLQSARSAVGGPRSMLTVDCLVPRSHGRLVAEVDRLSTEQLVAPLEPLLASPDPRQIHHNLVDEPVFRARSKPALDVSCHTHPERTLLSTASATSAFLEGVREWIQVSQSFPLFGAA